ncbi:hypothetical protein Goari_027016 [Gossypium aridum]|uniref:Uncharacterized protein n=1 Tax=Gossypium aridum TaxID=34290 RepID=A0A7J8YLA2_GOSAI|nr:hypothetical protein [Gossypium aridum]
MEMEFLGKVEDNAVVRVWSEKVQQEKGDSVVEGYIQALISSPYAVLESSLQLFHVWEGRFGTHSRRIYDLATVSEDPSRQSLFESSQCPDILEETNEYHKNERVVGCGPD